MMAKFSEHHVTFEDIGPLVKFRINDYSILLGRDDAVEVSHQLILMSRLELAHVGFVFKGRNSDLSISKTDLFKFTAPFEGVVGVQLSIVKFDAEISADWCVYDTKFMRNIGMQILNVVNEARQNEARSTP